MCKRILLLTVNIGMIGAFLLALMFVQSVVFNVPFASFLNSANAAEEVVPLIPDASSNDSEVRESLFDQTRSAIERPFTEASTPAHLSIPSVHIDSAIDPVGLDARGAMDVPTSKSDTVGWYKSGTVPGQTGSAVMAAHVNAAFENLKNAKVGDSVYIEMANGSRLHFVITDSMRYRASDVPAEFLFNRQNGKYVHLVTCTGRWDSERKAYDERLIVYATLLE